MPFYAVKRGRTPGVYESWAACQNQIDGYTGARYKKFSDEAEAYAFAEVPMEKSSEDGDTTKGFDQLISKYESKVTELSSLTDSLVSSLTKLDKSEICLEFSKIVNNLESDVSKLKATTYLAVRSKFLETSGKRKSGGDGADAAAAPEKKKKAVLEPRFTGDSFEDDEGVIVYTDGCCFHNGKHGASAGIGVYWGSDAEDNVSERLGGRQTNNRAEIHAVIKAVEQAIKKNIENLIINTDSMFLINCVTKWMAGWKKKGWVKSDGEEVTNKEELQELDGLMEDINIKWVHVDAHCGIPGNEAADKLANKGARRPLEE